MSALERYKLKKLVKELDRKTGRGTELISLYIPPSRRISDVIAYLREELSTADNIKSKSTRKNVQSALESIMQRLKLYRKTPPNGLVVFCGVVPRAGPGTEKLEIYLIEPPERLDVFLYRCDSRFHTEFLKEMLAEKKCYGIILLDRSEATFALLKGRRVEVLDNITSGVPGKHSAGGQSQRRFERIIEQLAHEFYKRVGEYATKYFLNLHKQGVLAGILIGGPGPTKYDFVNKDYMHYELKQKVIGVFDIGYAGEEGLRELMHKASEKLREVRHIQERKLVQELLYYIATKPENVAYGINEVLSLLNDPRLKVVLASEALDEKPVVVGYCKSCGEKVLYLPKSREEVYQIKELKCKRCKATTADIRVISLLEYLIEELEGKRARLEIISAETEEGQQLLKAFFGLAAFLG